MSNRRIVVRCVVYDGERLIEVKEQEMPNVQLRVALRRAHFNSSFVEAMERGYTIAFESKERK